MTSFAPRLTPAAPVLDTVRLRLSDRAFATLCRDIRPVAANGAVA